MKFYVLFFVSIGFSFPPSFSLDRQTETVSDGLPDNGIIDIEAVSNTHLFFGTSSGLGRADIDGGDKTFRVVMSDAMPEGGNPALVTQGSVIAVSGVTSYYSIATESNEPKGTGLAYSLDLGDTWNFMEQPIVNNPADGMYYDIEWGGQILKILAVTTAVNNVSYDLAIGGDYIYSTSWAGGLQRFRYTDSNPKWEVIPLPMDNQSELLCGEIDADVYELNPKDPGDGGNHNHKGFSVFIDNEVIFVGTANGLNRGEIVDDCINWSHYTTAEGLSGNWVVGIDSGMGTDNIEKLWAISWATASTESIGLSYSYDNAISWENVNFFTDAGIKVYNIEFSENQIYASTIEGLYVSQDGEHWELTPDFVDSITGEMILDNAVYTSHSFNESDEIWIGTGDGLVIRESNGLVDIFRFWEATDKPSEGEFNFSVYPNPFYLKDHNVLDYSGHVRFIYNIDGNGVIDIYDFSMDHVVGLNNSHFAGSNGESEIIWDGRNSRGAIVANGVYFCKLSTNGQNYWTKLVVVN